MLKIEERNKTIILSWGKEVRSRFGISFTRLRSVISFDVRFVSICCFFNQADMRWEEAKNRTSMFPRGKNLKLDHERKVDPKLSGKEKRLKRAGIMKTFPCLAKAEEKIGWTELFTCCDPYSRWFDTIYG